MSQLSDFLAAHGQVVNVKTEQDPSSADPTKMARRYVMSDGSEILVTDEGEVVGTKLPQTKPPSTDPSQVAADDLATELKKQREENYRNGKGYYTDEQVAARERQQAQDEKSEREKREALERQTEQQREANRLAQERLQAELANQAADNARADQAEARAAAAANRPSIVSTSPTQRRVTQFNPATNSYEAVDNPGFDQAAYDRQAAKEKAQAERDRLSLMIEAGKLTEASAAAQYKRWFDENVTIPLQRSQEARARAEELRQAQEAEDRRQQFAANYEKDRQTTAIHAGEAAANAFNSNLPYQVGPAFGEQFAKALDSFQPGAPPAHFTADAFTFKGPSIEAVARKATANALAGISPYAQAIATAGNRPLQVASYGPGTEMGGAPPPPAATPPDYAGLVNQYLQNNPYVPGGGDTEEDQ